MIEYVHISFSVVKNTEITARDRSCSYHGHDTNDVLSFRGKRGATRTNLVRTHFLVLRKQSTSEVASGRRKWTKTGIGALNGPLELTGAAGKYDFPRAKTGFGRQRRALSPDYGFKGVCLVACLWVQDAIFLWPKVQISTS